MTNISKDEFNNIKREQLRLLVKSIVRMQSWSNLTEDERVGLLRAEQILTKALARSNRDHNGPLC